LGRVVAKIVNDFTSIVQFRHPLDIGGLSWTISLIFTLVSLPVAVWIYGTKVGKEDKVYNGAFIAALALIPTVTAVLVIFFLSIEQDYLHTFINPIRGIDVTINQFRNSKDDEAKADAVFKRTKHHMLTIEEEVRGWVEENWSRWQDEQPKWLNERMMVRIPLDFIPTSFERKKEKKRRTSMVQEQGGGAKKIAPEAG